MFLAIFASLGSHSISRLKLIWERFVVELNSDGPGKSSFRNWASAVCTRFQLNLYWQLSFYVICGLSTEHRAVLHSDKGLRSKPQLKKLFKVTNLHHQLSWSNQIISLWVAQRSRFTTLSFKPLHFQLKPRSNISLQDRINIKLTGTEDNKNISTKRYYVIQ